MYLTYVHACMHTKRGLCRSHTEAGQEVFSAASDLHRFFFSWFLAGTNSATSRNSPLEFCGRMLSSSSACPCCTPFHARLGFSVTQNG